MQIAQDASVIFLQFLSWQIGKSGVNSTEIITAPLFALQSAILSVLLEWFCPIRNWKIENDLWQHPRKYIVPPMYQFSTGLCIYCKVREIA